MARRRLLRDHLTTAWNLTIRQQHEEQFIDSEHGLQMYFCSALLLVFE